MPLTKGSNKLCIQKNLSQAAYGYGLNFAEFCFMWLNISESHCSMTWAVAPTVGNKCNYTTAFTDGHLH